MRKVLLDTFGTATEPVRRRELWLAILTVGIVVITFLVSQVAGRMGTEEADTVAPSAQVQLARAS